MAKPTRPKDDKLEAGGEASAPLPPSGAPSPPRPETATKAEPPTAPKQAEPPPPPPAAAAPEAPKTARYRVWPHGTLQRNGKTYKPDDELTLSVEDAAKIPCLEKA